MKTILINGIKAQDFGSNNVSCGMSAIIFNPKDVSIEQVKALPNVFLHPTMKPNQVEIFAILGTEEQYKEFYNDCVRSYAAKKASSEKGFPPFKDEEAWSKLDAETEQLVKDFKPWWEE